jgi:RHS repeat-associated protein
MAYRDADQTRRVEAGDMRYAYSQLGLSAQADGSSGVPHTTYFMRDPEGTLLGHRERAGASHYYLLDGLGSVIAVTDQNGALVASSDYEPYGEVSGTTGQAGITPFGFASGYLDEAIGWTKFGTRYYEPSEMMRWTQVDPERGNIENPLSLNPYLYVQGSPTNATDPTGQFLVPLFWGAFAGFTALWAADELGAPPVFGGFVGGCVGGIAAGVFTAGVGTLATLAACGIVGGFGALGRAVTS